MRKYPNHYYHSNGNENENSQHTLDQNRDQILNNQTYPELNKIIHTPGKARHTDENRGRPRNLHNGAWGSSFLTFLKANHTIKTTISRTINGIKRNTPKEEQTASQHQPSTENLKRGGSTTPDRQRSRKGKQTPTPPHTHTHQQWQW